VKRNILGWGLLAFASPSIGLAAHCHGVAELRSRVKSCYDNAFYAEAAVLCVEKFQKEVDKATGRMSKALTEGVKKMESAQQQNFVTTGDSYQLSEDTLKRLIKQGEASKAEVAAYSEEIVFPEDLGEGEGADELKGSRCYQRNQDVLRLVQRDFTQKIADLKRTRGAAKALHKSTGTSEAGLGASKENLRKAVSGAKGLGAGRDRYSGHGPQRTGGSDISGSEKLNKKPVTKKPAVQK
jgi:hypothetical protein